MNWIEKHWILCLVIVVAAVYLYTQYGSSLLGSGSDSSTGATLQS